MSKNLVLEVRDINHLGSFNDDEDYSQYENETDQEAYEPTEVTISRLLRGEKVATSYGEYKCDLSKQSLDEALESGFDPTRSPDFDLADVIEIQNRAEAVKKSIADRKVKEAKEAEKKAKIDKIQADKDKLIEKPVEDKKS